MPKNTGIGSRYTTAAGRASLNISDSTWVQLKSATQASVIRKAALGKALPPARTVKKRAAS